MSTRQRQAPTLTISSTADVAAEHIAAAVTKPMAKRTVALSFEPWMSSSRPSSMATASKATADTVTGCSNDRLSSRPGRRRGCHFAGTPSSSLLKRLLKEEGGAAIYDKTLADGCPGPAGWPTTAGSDRADSSPSALLLSERSWWLQRIIHMPCATVLGGWGRASCWRLVPCARGVGLAGQPRHHRGDFVMG